LLLKGSIALFPAVKTLLDQLHQLIDAFNWIDAHAPDWLKGKIPNVLGGAALPIAPSPSILKILPGLKIGPQVPPDWKPPPEAGTKPLYFSGQGQGGLWGGDASWPPLSKNIQDRRGERAPISMRGLAGTPAQPAMDEFQRAIKAGTFDALVEFSTYGGGGFGDGGGGGSAPGYGIGHGRLGGGSSSLGGRPGAPSGPGGATTAPSGPGGPGAGPGGARLNDESGKPIDPQTMKEAEALGRAGDVPGLQKLFAEKGYRMSGPACGIVASAYVKSAGFKPPSGGAVASNWNDWGQAAAPSDINKEGHPFGSMIGSYQTRRYGGNVGAPLGKGQTGGHVMTIVPGTFDPKTNTAMFADQYGVRRRSIKGMDLRYAGDEAVAAAAAAGQTPSGATVPQGGGTKATWFDTGGKIPGWSDSSGQREGAQASRLPSTTPGIATPGSAGLGEWFQVTLPDGRVVVTQKTDVGPGKGPQSKGVGLDVNAALASQLYPGGPGTFPSGKGGFHVKPLGPRLPSGIKPGLQTGAAKSAPAGVQAPPAGQGGMSVAQLHRKPEVEVSDAGPKVHPNDDLQFHDTSKDEDAKLIDTAISPTRINGHVNVTVHSNGTKATTAVKHRGKLFQKSTIKQHRQMQPTSSPSTGAPGSSDDLGGGIGGGAD
jgi:hypothetical protein